MIAHDRHHLEHRSVLGGFTLIEVVVAMAVFGLLALVMFQGLQFAQRAHRQVTSHAAAAGEVFAAQRFLRQVLESAHPLDLSRAGLEQPAFEGSTERVVMIAEASLAMERAGLVRYEFLVAPFEQSRALWVRIQPQHASDDRHPYAEVLLRNVASVSWGYRGRDSEQWVSAWTHELLPAAMRLNVVFENDESPRWPELIVAPRITEDANCTFDVVAQRCRASV